MGHIILTAALNYSTSIGFQSLLGSVTETLEKIALQKDPSL